MIVFHGLGHVDDAEMPVVKQDVVFAQVGVYQLALSVELPHDQDTLQIELPRLPLGQIHVFELRRGPAVDPDELHEEHVAAQEDGAGARDAVGVEARQVPHLLLGPESDHLPGVVAGVAVPESEFSGHVLVPVLEDQDGRLVDLQRAVALRAGCIIHVSLLPCADAAVDLRDEPSAQHLEEDHPGAGVEDLFGGGPVCLVLPTIAAALVVGNLIQERVDGSARERTLDVPEVDTVLKPLTKREGKRKGVDDVLLSTVAPPNVAPRKSVLIREVS